MIEGLNSKCYTAAVGILWSCWSCCALLRYSWIRLCLTTQGIRAAPQCCRSFEIALSVLLFVTISIGSNCWWSRLLDRFSVFDCNCNFVLLLLFSLLSLYCFKFSCCFSGRCCFWSLLFCVSFFLSLSQRSCSLLLLFKGFLVIFLRKLSCLFVSLFFKSGFLSSLRVLFVFLCLFLEFFRLFCGLLRSSVSLLLFLLRSNFS